jgi:RNA polymerase sigma-54 factor
LSLTFDFTMAPRFGLEVSPALIAFGELLMLPCAAVQTLVDDEVSANAELERLEPGECPICRGSWRMRCPVCTRTTHGTAPASWTSPQLPAAEPDTETLRQAVRAETGRADAAAVDHLIDSLDQHGVFDRTCAELATEMGAPEAYVIALVEVIRRCGPPGVGATSIAECLLLQLDALGLPDDDLVRAILADHLPGLARGHFTAIAEALGTTRDEVRRALELIRERLRPYPAFDGTARPVPAYVVPDVVIRADPAVAGGFRIDLVEAAITRLRARPGGPGAGAARFFLAQLRDRWETLRRVVEFVAAHQRGFLTGGPSRLRPLTRAEVAVALDLHESTVSRAVAEKYVLMPDGGTTSLSAFFGASGGADEALRGLLAADGGRLSDQRLADRMRDAGYPMARRTVAKHRARLGFTAAALR